MPFSGFDFMNALNAAHGEHRALAPEALSRVYSVFAAIGFGRERIHYLVKRADATGGVDPRVLAEQLGGPPEFHLMSDGRLVVEANNQGVPFVLVEPEARISKEMPQIAVSLLQAQTVAVAATR